MKFSNLGLANEIQQALEVCGYSEMTPVQEQAIVPARRGKDLLVNAQTGNAKAAVLPVPVWAIPKTSLPSRAGGIAPA